MSLKILNRRCILNLSARTRRKKSSGFFVYMKSYFYICGMKINFTYNIRIENEKFGTLLNETFVDGIQFKLFLKMVHGCIELKNDLTFFNGVEFFVHIPYKHLVNSIITTNVDLYTLADHLVAKSKMEAVETK